ncbi:MAG: hypothetical protein CXZ00_10120 [Acidobacteria bacterium]|nr:MAG: hypothetical protein CXZ00_10120 [Acidobacteriota bacterium]
MRCQLICVFLLLTIVPALRADEACWEAKAGKSAEKAQTIQAALLAVGIEDMSTTVPKSARPKILAFKEALVATADAAMQCETKNAVDARALESGLARLLFANRQDALEERVTHHPSLDSQAITISDHIYGGRLRISVERSSNTPNLLTIEASFRIECGEDSLLLVYEWSGGAWHRVIRWQSPEYKEISGAFGDFFQYALIPNAGSEGHWAVAVAHGTPWCSSRISNFQIDVIRPEGAGQRAIFNYESDYSRMDVNPVLKRTSDGKGFELRLQRNSSDANLVTYAGIFRYQVNRDSVQRVQPIATNGRGFVEEWLAASWDEAGQWCAPAALEALKQEHAKMDQQMQSEHPPAIRYMAVRGCSDDAKHFQVELQKNPGDPMYFQLQQGENSFTMVSASKNPDQRCNGINIMKK